MQLVCLTLCVCEKSPPSAARSSLRATFSFLKCVKLSVLLPVRRGWGVAGWSMSCQRISHKRLSLLWEGAALSLWLCCCWTSTSAAATAAAAAAGQGDGAPDSLGWLLSDKGPFHQSLEFTEAAERYQQGFSTRYKIYRWGRCVRVRVCVKHSLCAHHPGLCLWCVAFRSFRFGLWVFIGFHFLQTWHWVISLMSTLS